MAEKKYINADKFVEWLKSQSETCADKLIVAVVEGSVNKYPPADVAEVNHGKWLNFTNDFSAAECSQCGEVYTVSDYKGKKHFEIFKHFCKYCPNCGARMDGDGN